MTRPQLPSRRADWRRLLQLLATYMALVLVMQALAASHVRALGPLHHHRDDGPPAASAWVAPARAGSHAHADGQRHWHTSAEDAAGLRGAGATEDLDTAAWALAAAMALLAFAAAWLPGAARPAHGWRTNALWSVCHAPARRPFEPPRAHLSH